MSEKNQGLQHREESGRSRQMLANANLLKIPFFTFFDKSYLEKRHCITIENISNKKMQLKQLKLVL